MTMSNSDGETPKLDFHKKVEPCNLTNGQSYECSGCSAEGGKMWRLIDAVNRPYLFCTRCARKQSENFVAAFLSDNNFGWWQRLPKYSKKG